MRERLKWNDERLDGILSGLADMKPVGSTGIAALDVKLGGGLCPQVYVLAAEPAAGKTTLALQMADQIAQTGSRRALFVSLEMSAAQIVAKSISRVSSAHFKSPLTIGDLVHFGELEGHMRGVAQNAIEAYREEYAPNIATIDEAVTVGDIRELYESLESEDAVHMLPPVLFVDYLQMMPTEDEQSTDYLHHTENMRGLAQISKDFGTPVVVISSKNRSGRNSKGLASLMGSSEIEYSAGAVMLLDIDAEGEEEREAVKSQDVRPVVLSVVKNRFGACGDVRLDFRATENRFAER